jgi:hypothetical protein
MSRRSPVILWLLFAATLCVDAVAIYWSYAVTLDRTEQLYFGLACGQISVVTIWAFFAAARRPWQWLVPFLAVAAAAQLTTWLYHAADANIGAGPHQLLITYFCLWIPQVVLIIAILWFLGQTSFADRWRPPSAAQRWRFAIRHLLIITTVLALMLVIMRQAEIVRTVPATLAAWIANNTAVAIVAFMIRTSRWHFFLRLAATAGASILLAFAVFAGLQARTPHAIAVNLIQAIVLFLWLELGRITPERLDSGDAADSPSTRTEDSPT